MGGDEAADEAADGKKSIRINPLPSNPRHHHGAPREMALVAAHKGALVILAAESRRESPEGVSTCDTPSSCRNSTGT